MNVMTAIQVDQATRQVYVTAKLGNTAARESSITEMKRAARYPAPNEKEFISVIKRSDGTWVVQLRPKQLEPTFRAWGLSLQQATSLMQELMVIQATKVVP